MTPIADCTRRIAAMRCAALTAAALAATLLAPPVTAQQGDALRGRLLYENHCQDCHTSRAHVRAARKAGSAASVRGQVSRWQGVQGLRWSQDDIEDVTTWLYLRFYDPARPQAAPDNSGGRSG
jgi:mono/diheme cytochrome c family protein